MEANKKRKVTFVWTAGYCYASLQSEQGELIGKGSSQEEALGALVKSHQEIFQLEVQRV